MRFKVMSIYDKQAEMHSQPMFFVSIGAAIRGFGDEVKREDKQNNLHTHPEDFTLFHVADWDDETGSFEPVDRQRVAAAADFKV